MLFLTFRVFVWLIVAGVMQCKEYPKNYPYCYEWNVTSNGFSKKYVDIPSDAPALRPGFWTDPPKGPYRSRSNPHSQQDTIVLLILKDMSNGFYLDLASNDPEYDSNTFVFEYYNKWQGICIEPDPMFYPKLVAQRKCKVFINPVASQAGLKVKFHIDVGTGGIVGPDYDNSAPRPSGDTYMITTTLNEILAFAQAPRVIHYFSLDIEGAEYLALEKFDFAKYTFLVITVERPKAKLHTLLTQHGYVFVYTMGGNYGECLYVHHTLPNLGDVMRQYHNAQVVPSWFQKEHPFLLHPPWLGHYRPPAAPVQPPSEP